MLVDNNKAGTADDAGDDKLVAMSCVPFATLAVCILSSPSLPPAAKYDVENMNCEDVHDDDVADGEG